MEAASSWFLMNNNLVLLLSKIVDEEVKHDH